MKNQQLKEQSLLYLLSQNNFIVPEIQREYVWGNNEDVLNRFLDSLIEKIGDVCNDCGNPKNNTKINIGFLYTYKPNYVTYSFERFLDENLIDGQQRFTTLFLLLFYCALKEDRINDFKDAIRIENDLEMAFDYKVRNLTHVFLIQLVNKVDSLKILNNVLEDKTTWLLKDFKKDYTVKSMISALKIIDNKFRNKEQQIFNFILNNVKFYHFRTEATNQGEELYITMNARGEALSKNEESKAALMFDDNLLPVFGKKWEEWQDFFWKNRDKSIENSNADIGFNEFLRWVQIIEMTVSDEEVDIEDDEKIAEESLTKEIITLIQGDAIKLNKKYFSIEKIDNYFQVIKYLFEDYYSDLNYQTQYSESLDLKVIKKRYLHPTKNKRIEQGEIFELVPVIYYLYRLNELNKIVNNENIFRLLRFFQNNRKDITVRKTINKQVINAINLIDVILENDYSDIADIIKLNDKRISKTLLNKEEFFKFQVYLASKKRKEIESTFWIAEDNKILNGKIASLIQYSYFQNDIENFEYNESFTKYNYNHFSKDNFVDVFFNFLKLTEEKEKISNKIWGSLFLTDYYSIRDYNEKLKTVVCENIEDDHLLRSKVFFNKISEIQPYENAESYFKDIFNEFLKEYNSIDDLKAEESYKKQLYIYFYKLSTENGWHFGKGKNFGVYLYPSKFKSFFNLGIRFQHYNIKWHGADYNYFADDKGKLEKFYKKYLA